MTAEVASRLQQFIDMHRKIGQQVEPDFMHLGNALQAVYADAGELTRQSVATIELLGTEDSSVLIDLRQLAGKALEELRSRNRKIGRNLEVAQAITTRLGGLIVQTEFLDKIGLYLGVVGLNIGVESTRSAKAAGMFSGVEQEVKKLAAKVRSVGSEIVAECEKEQRGQQTAGRRIAQGLAALKRLAQEAELAVEQAVGCIEEIMGMVLAALADANEHAEQITAQIGEVVMGIQLHDSMSQRFTHLVQSLTIVVDSLSPTENDLAREDRLQRLAMARRLILLQAGQIEGMVEETKEASRKSKFAFEIIDQRVAALGNCFSILTDAAVNQDSSADPLFLLQNSLARLSRLLAEGSALIEQLNESARQTSRMAGRLVGHLKIIESIRFDIHTKALNTIILAAHLGDQGRTMEVLARETKTLSDQAGDFVGEVKAIHRTIAESVQELQIEDTGRAAGNQDRELLGSSVGVIAETMARFNRESAGAGGQAEILRGAIAKAGDDLGFLDRLMAELNEQHQQLAAIAEFIPPLVEQVDQGTAMKDCSRLQALYTMEKEHKLHAVMLGADDLDSLGAIGEPTAARGGDNGSPIAAVHDARQSTAIAQDDNIELF